MLDKRLGRKVPLFTTTGLKARYVCEDETQVDLAVVACQAAIKDAGLVSADIEMVISGSAVPYQTLSATNRLIMCRLGIADGQASVSDTLHDTAWIVNLIDARAPAPKKRGPYLKKSNHSIELRFTGFTFEEEISIISYGKRPDGIRQTNRAAP